MENNTSGRHRGLRLRLVCDQALRTLLSGLLASRGLGPSEGAPLALVERGMDGSGTAAPTIAIQADLWNWMKGVKLHSGR